MQDWGPISRFKIFFSIGHERTIQAKKNIAASFVIKGGSVLILLLLVPMTINYVSPSQYGVWITLSSIINWFNFFDIGFGNGLKNRLAEAFSRGEVKLGRIYISTTYLILTLISVGLLCCFVLVNFFLDWSKVVNVPEHYAQELNLIVLILFFVFCFQFVFQLINVVSTATQNTIFPNLIGLLGNILSLVILFFLTRTTQGSLLYLCFSIGISPLISLILFSVGLYRTRYKDLAPSFSLAKLSYSKDLMHLGFKFFMIQIGFIIFYNSNNIIISHIIGPDAVTPYSVAFQYFSVITMISGIIMTPFWSAFTDANAKKDYVWIKNTVNKLEKLGAAGFFLSLIMLVASPLVYHYWLGEKVSIPFSLSAVFSFYVALNMARTIYCSYLNGVGVVMMQIYTLSICAVINIPLAIFLGKNFGVTGVILSTTILSFLCGIVEFTQYKKVVNLKGQWYLE